MKTEKDRGVSIIGSGGVGNTTTTGIPDNELRVEPPTDVEMAEILNKDPYIPTAQEIKYHKAMRKESVLYRKVWDYLREKNVTMQEEYELILAKESEMPKAQRDYLQAITEYVPTEEEVKAMEDRDSRIADYQAERAKQEAADEEE